MAGDEQLRGVFAFEPNAENEKCENGQTKWIEKGIEEYGTENT